MTPLTPPVPLLADHDLSTFACGREELDLWLRERALKAENRSARTYVVCAGNEVVGYYCLAMGAEKRASLPKPLSRNMPDPIPLMIVGRLAVDRRHQGAGLGSALLKDAIKRALSATKIVGCRAIFVHAIDGTAAAFYGKFGFIAFPEDAQKLVLPIETAQAAL